MSNKILPYHTILYPVRFRDEHKYTLNGNGDKTHPCLTPVVAVKWKDWYDSI